MAGKIAYVVMREDFTKHGNDYYPYRVFLSEMEAGKWLNDLPDYAGQVEFTIEEVELIGR